MIRIMKFVWLLICVPFILIVTKGHGWDTAIKDAWHVSGINNRAGI